MSHTLIGRLISFFYTLRFYLWRLLTFLPTAVFAYLHITRGTSGKYILYAYLAHVLIWGAWHLISWGISTLVRAGREAEQEMRASTPRENKNPYSHGRKEAAQKYKK